MSICTGYHKDAALDFYGFNGFQSNFDMGLISNNIYFDTSTKAGNKLEKKFIEKNKTPKGFYRYGRDLIRIKADFTGKIAKNFYWEAGYNFNWVGAKSFTPTGYSNFSKEKDNEIGIEGGTTLFQLYKDWGIISPEQANGGFISSVRAGLMYDSRNVENNPTKGIWAEAHMIAAPKWSGAFEVCERPYRYSLRARYGEPYCIAQCRHHVIAPRCDNLGLRD